MIALIVVLSILITIAMWRLAARIVGDAHTPLRMTATRSRVRPVSILSLAVAVGSGLLLLTLRPDASSLEFLLIRAMALLSVVLLVIGMRGRQ